MGAAIQTTTKGKPIKTAKGWLSAKQPINAAALRLIKQQNAKRLGLKLGY